MTKVELNKKTEQLEALKAEIKTLEVNIKNKMYSEVAMDCEIKNRQESIKVLEAEIKAAKAKDEK